MNTTHDDLVTQLEALGRDLDLGGDVSGDDGDDRLIDDVLVRIRDDATPDRPARTTWLAAAAVLVLVIGLVVTPASREAVARWFGLDGVTIEVDPTAELEPVPESFDLPGPGETRVVTVDGDEVLVSAIDGGLSEIGITKTVQSSDQVSDVDVGGRPGLWVAGGSHQVAYETPEGEFEVTRVASNTLLWQDGTVLFRVEGFTELDDALAFANGTRSGRPVSDGS